MGGGNCLKYLKRSGTENRGEDIKILKRKGGGQAGSRRGSVSIQVIPFFMVYLLPLSHQHQPTMINTIGTAGEQ